MSRIALSDSGDWQLEFPDDQDIRGYRAVDKDGAPIGVVDAMIVDTEAERVSSIVLEDGTEYPADDLSIGDGVVYLTTVDLSDDARGSVRSFADCSQALRRSAAPTADFDAHREAFVTHHGTAYGTGRFEDVEPAYRYGFEAAHQDDYRNAAFVDLEDRIRTTYGSAFTDRDYDADRSAVRYGYTRAQHATR